ncbi:putative sulfate exporter family transporter [Fluviicola sp.]|uniref:YeiH family protein n=1 Tax=Fluviicola sp. TaxID=1917219 RepID=UPI00262517F0|nr:putative sulfate exporter family transporter [Fluviicola sp.]
MKTEHFAESKETEKRLRLKFTTREIIFFLVLIVCLTPLISPPLALLSGLIIANLSGHPFLHLNHKITQVLLQASVVGLGFSMNVNSALAAGKNGFSVTILSIFSTLILGTLLGKWFKTDKKTSHLIASGTAICGGSAIAAISPVIKAGEKQISTALGIIFILNSIALFVFPVIGHWFGLTQEQFGMWCAISIHDTSSVVGAANKYGPEALQIATTIKLARALWIIPLAVISAALFRNKSGGIKMPYFIGLFILAIILNTYIPQMAVVAPYIVSISKTGLTLTLFLIGAGLNYNMLRSVGIKPFLQGIILWIFISLATLYVITQWF